MSGIRPTPTSSSATAAARRLTGADQAPTSATPFDDVIDPATADARQRFGASRSVDVLSRRWVR